MSKRISHGREESITPELKGWDCPDISNLDAWLPPTSEIIYWLTLSIGLPGSPPADNFQICVATPEGLKSDDGRRIRPKGNSAPPIVLQTYSSPAVLDEVHRRLAHCSGGDWADIQDKLRASFNWEYEGMK